jgi:two-component sensor histidine kinase
MSSVTPTAKQPDPPSPGAEPDRSRGGRISAATLPLYLRLAILLAAILLPALIFSIVSAYTSYRDNQARTRESIVRFAELAAARTQLLIDSTRRLLITLSTTDLLEEAQANAALCGQRLASLSKVFDEYRNFSLTDAAGRVICASLASATDVNVSDRPWFQQVKSSGTATVSQLVRSKLDNQPVVVVAVPMNQPGKPFRGAVAVGINVLWLAGLSASTDMPEQSTAFLIDRTGTAVTQSGKLVEQLQSPPNAGNADLVAFPDAGALHKAMAGHTKQFTGNGADGISRLYTLTSLRHTDLFVVVSLVESGPFGWAKRDFTRQMAAALAMLLCALLGVAVGSDLLIARNIRALSATAEALQRGDYSVRPQVTGGSREVRQLAMTLSSMADQVQHHEQDMRRSVQAKDAMLKEIHHRVKNNLQVVTSLMSIQANRLHDEASKRALAELQRRVRALGLLHRHLYEGDDLRYLDFGQFTVELCQMVKESSGPAARAVNIEVDIPPIPITADRAVPLGLLITEALGNAFKHGFPGGRVGEIRISLSATAEGVATVSIADNGIGPPPDRAEEQKSDPGTGMLLMEAFAQQLGSVLSVVGPPGTTIGFSFDLTEPGIIPPA